MFYSVDVGETPEALAVIGNAFEQDWRLSGWSRDHALFIGSIVGDNADLVLLATRDMSSLVLTAHAAAWVPYDAHSSDAWGRLGGHEEAWSDFALKRPDFT
jgi:hypothetical protein